MTFQNAQGKTIRGPKEVDEQGQIIEQPKGFLIDLFKPRNMMKDEYFQHLYMILGRARKLDWTLLRNFPTLPDGEPDWEIFEQGPPAYLCEFMDCLEKRAQSTLPRTRICYLSGTWLPIWSARLPA